MRCHDMHGNIMHGPLAQTQTYARNTRMHTFLMPCVPGTAFPPNSPCVADPPPPPPPVQGATSLLVAATWGQLEMVRVLVAAGAKVNATSKGGTTSVCVPRRT